MSHQPQRMPGPKGHFLFGHLREYRRDKVALFLRAMHDYGDMVYLRIGNQHVCLVSDPESIIKVLQHESHNYKTASSYRELEKLIGQGLVTTAGESWRQHRTALQPLFRMNNLSPVVTICAELTRRAIGSWFNGLANAASPIDIYQEMRHLTMDITSAVLFGSASSIPKDDFNQAFDSAHYYLMQRIESFIKLELPTPARRAFHRSKHALYTYIDQIIQQHRSASSSCQTMLSAMMQARDEAAGQLFSDRELRDEVLTLFLAGYDTTATALTWLFYLLSQHPEGSLRRFLRI
ncbi:cytochrome P450 [Candidatus Entotheonella palauensis]|uniref:cytochrome P450 n=1 Tax=Candidatus Entotheonella palauensis TaxID=93172 RepID=UPI000B7CED1A|nr:cytochrome P450 [Candidatus Entotheonella palauensis]